VLPVLFGRLAGDPDAGRAIFEHFAPISAEAPYPLTRAQDWLWFWNFSQKWEHVRWRHLLYEDRADYRPLFGRVAHFFDSDAFQVWSMTHPDEKIGARIDTYKFPAKRYIVDYTRDADYLTKLKVGSLCKVWRPASVAAVTVDGRPVDAAGLRAFVRTAVPKQ
jgi:hypothetical protein